MNNIVTESQNDLIAIEKALVEGDLKPLSVPQRIAYITKMCTDTGLLATTKPFDFIMFQGRMIAYPNKNCAEQLRRRDGISINVASRDKFDNMVSITVRASSKDGRSDEATAYLDITGLSGQNLANAMMKLETKAKRRVTLSICGLGMNDETEWANVESAVPVQVDFDQPEKISENLEKAKANDKQEVAKKPRNEAPVSMKELQMISNKMELIGVKSTDLKAISSQLWAIDDAKKLKIYQAEIIIEILSKSKNREDFGINISSYEENVVK